VTQSLRARGSINRSTRALVPINQITNISRGGESYVRKRLSEGLSKSLELYFLRRNAAKDVTDGSPVFSLSCLAASSDLPSGFHTPILQTGKTSLPQASRFRSPVLPSQVEKTFH
jgi:hypothetical protein